ncbi:MAG TPA: DUF2059 domain-containing protein [Chthoniobacterales bacterium]|jgi:hypothetical protein
MKLYILLIIGLFASSASLHAAVEPEKKKEIEEMLKLTGAESMMRQMITQMIGQMQKGMPAAPAGFWEKFSAKMDTREFMEMIIPVYDKYYTLEDLRAANAFYSSAAGKRMVSTMPQIMSESMKMGQAWGEKIGRQAAEEIAAEAKAAATPAS